MLILKHSNLQLELLAAKNWMERIVSNEKDSANLLPAFLDTYANLLHKQGNTKDALLVEQKALKMAIENNVPNYIEAFEEAISRMRQGEATW